MWIGGRRRGGAKALADHLRRTDENESVKIIKIEGFSFDKPNSENLEKAFKEIESIGLGNANRRNLYHCILALPEKEVLNAKQQQFMVDYYAEHMNFKDHQYALVEHWKHGRQHFHLVFNMTHPETGKIHELNWSGAKEWRISRGLEEILGLKPPKAKGKPANVWAMQRGKRTGIDPRKMRNEITGIFESSRTAAEFKDALDKAGYALTKGNRGQLVLVDLAGDTHGLMRMIEGKKVADLRRKFAGIEDMPLPSHESLVNSRKRVTHDEKPVTREKIDPQRVKVDVKRAYDTSATGAAFLAKLNRKEYSLGRGYRSFAVINRNGGRHELKKLLGYEAAKGLYQKFPDLAAIRPRYVSEIIRRIKASHRTGKRKGVTRGGGLIGNLAPVTRPAPASLPVNQQFRLAAHAVTHRQEQQPAPNRPPMGRKEGWPEAAVRDWESWGRQAPRRFFARWPELAI